MFTVLWRYMITAEFFVYVRMMAEEGACPASAAGGKPDPVTELGCTVTGAGDWLAALPGRLVHLAAVGWPWLLAAVVLLGALLLVVRVAYRRVWRRTVRRGYWVQLIPPRVLDPTQAGGVWRLLAALARRTRTGWHLARPPLAFEVYASGGQLVAGLWLPHWVPLSAVTAEVTRAWPGVRAQRRTPPVVAASEGWRVAGFRLVATGSDLGPLTDDPRPSGRVVRGPGSDADPLRAVLAGMARPDGPAVLQVLARPATPKRSAALGHAARSGVKPRRPARVRAANAVTAVLVGALRFVLDAVLDLMSTGRSSSGSYGGQNRGGGYGGYEPRRPADPLAARAMRDAADKLADGPHLLATVRVGAARPDAGFAVTAAQSIADGYMIASRALRPVRLRRAEVSLADRWAGRGDWLLFTATELGVLVHFPADPARYGFEVAALHRTHPTAARRAKAEHGSRRGPGWTRRGWTEPTDDQDEGEEDTP